MCFYDAPPNSLMGSTVNLKVTPMEAEGARASSLACNTSRVEGRVGAPGWGLGRLIRKLITHTDLHKSNHELVSAWLEPFWCMDEPWAITNSQDSPWFGLRGNHHLPPYSILCAWPWGQHPNVILFWDSQNWDFCNFGGLKLCVHTSD
jgi:hypothetical protein